MFAIVSTNRFEGFPIFFHDEDSYFLANKGYCIMKFESCGEKKSWIKIWKYWSMI